jgi:hypothetical protein
MANANKILAPSKDFKNEKLYMEMDFDPSKKYMFELAEENQEREFPVIGMIGTKASPEPHRKHKPYHNIVFTSQIIWKGQRRGIRYYDGCTSIFIDEQPKEKDEINELMAQTRRRHFSDGKFGCHGDEKMLLQYMYICSWNAESPFRTRTANPIFIPLDNSKRATAELLKLDQTEKALQLAKDAKLMKMLIHANYLEIPVVDYDSGNELEEDEIRSLYRKRALRDSEAFIKSYGDKKIEVKYYINESLKSGLIKVDGNNVVWGSSGSIITDAAGMKTHEGISEKVFEFSQLADGEEFLIQLEALYK